MTTGGEPPISRCSIYGNEAMGDGGGIACEGSLGLITRCTISRNYASSGAGGIHISDPLTPLITNTVVSFSSEGAGIECEDGASPTIYHCCVFGNAGGDDVCDASPGDNLFADPLFCDPDAGDFTLHSNSPCAPPGATGCGRIGALPVGCGPVVVKPWSWGKIKGAYR